MRIGFDAKRAFLNNTGLGNYSRNIIEGLMNYSPEYDYVLFTPKLSDFRNRTGKAKIISPPSWLKTLAPVWRMTAIPSKASALNVQLYHGLTSELPLGMKSKGIKTVVTVHDLIFLRYPHLYNSVDVFIYKNKTIQACKAADKIIAISRQTKDDLINYLSVPEEKIEIIYQDCHESFHKKVSEDTLNVVRLKYKLPAEYILTVGTIEERKNHILLLKALKLLDQRYKLIIVGKPGPHKKQLEEFIRNNALGNQVVFLEFVDFKDLPALYQLAKVFVYPSYFEGFGIPIIEALNSETPVIASTGSCLEETGGAAALYTHPDNAAQLADLITKVYENEGLRKEMIEKGKAHALTFRKETTIPALINLYKSLL